MGTNTCCSNPHWSGRLHHHHHLHHLRHRHHHHLHHHRHCYHHLFLLMMMMRESKATPKQGSTTCGASSQVNLIQNYFSAFATNPVNGGSQAKCRSFRDKRLRDRGEKGRGKRKSRKKVVLPCAMHGVHHPQKEIPKIPRNT